METIENLEILPALALLAIKRNQTIPKLGIKEDGSLLKSLKQMVEVSAAEENY